LLPILRSHYYNPKQRGSWDKNALIENICPQISFENLAIQNDHMARLAYDEAIGQTTTEDRRAQLESRLKEYGNVNALALLEIWRNKFTPTTSPNPPSPPSRCPWPLPQSGG
jgi:hypothetical protein